MTQISTPQISSIHSVLDAIMRPIAEDLPRVEYALREGLRSVAPMIPEVGEHVFSGGGKRIRPALVLLAALLSGYRGPRAIQIAAAAEHLHTATLMHDDVVDGAEFRRGRPSVNVQFGSRLSILVGDFLYAVCCQLLVEDGNADVLATFAESIRTMAEGEVMQLSRSFDPEITESVYRGVIERKTAHLIASCTEAGAILGGVTRSERRALRDYGRELGVAFQLVDDALDYDSTGEELGKAPLADAVEGKVTLPLIVTLKRCSGGEREQLVASLKACASGEPNAVQTELPRIAEAVARYRGVEFTLQRARDCIQTARLCIEPFVDCAAKQSLLELADFVVKRRT